jgi:hypothetical protein
MKSTRLLLAIAISASALFTTAQTKLPYVIDPSSKKQITYTVATDGTFKYTFSNGKVGYPEIADVAAKSVYARAKAVTIVVTPPVTTAPIVVPITAPSPETSFTTVGTGSGSLELGTISDKKLKIKPGTYSHIGFSKATNVVIDATGVNLPHGSVDITDAINVEFFGFAVTDQSYRAVNIRGFCSGLYLHDLTFKNIGNDVIKYEYDGIYDGTDKTDSKDWKIENCSFTNTGCAVSFQGGFDDAGIKTYMSGFKFLNNKIQDSPVIGTAVYAPAADGYVIAGNTVNNINTVYTEKDPNGIHNGIFMMTGNGSFYNNKVTNHQGNAIRAWGVSFGSTIKPIKIYNNIVWNSWKYGAFELQFIPFYQDYKAKYPTRITYTNALIYNNTVGRMNVSSNWDGQILDNYFTGGTLDYYNNIGFDMKRNNGGLINGDNISDMINYNFTPVFGRYENNKYFPTASPAIKDIKSFEPLLSGLGAKL